MLREVVIKALQSEFGDRVKINPGSKEFAVFEAKDPAVGDAILEEDGDEVTIFVGDITHGHFGSYESSLSLKQDHEEIVAQSVVSFLIDLFADKYFLKQSRWYGSWIRCDKVKETDMLSPKVRWFKWSGPIHLTDEEK